MVNTNSLIVAYGLALLPVLVRSSPIVPRYFQGNLFSRDHISANTVKAELGPQLAKDSLIFGPNSTLYPGATERWNTRITPNSQVVVQPAAESDVAKIVSGLLRRFLKNLMTLLLTLVNIGQVQS